MGEKALLNCSPGAFRVEHLLGLHSAPARLDGSARLLLTLELLDFEKGRDSWSLSEGEKVQLAAERKDVFLRRLFKLGRVELALGRASYKMVPRSC